MVKFQKNNQGISLTEIVIAIAIMAIVSTMIFQMINTASRSFRRTNDKVNLQLESQLVLNQISSLVMEAKSITLSEDVSHPDKKYILEGKPYSALVLIAEDGKLYLIQKDRKEEVEAVREYDEEEYLLGDYVRDISIEESTGKSVSIKMDFQLGDELYSVHKTVRLRNVN